MNLSDMSVLVAIGFASLTLLIGLLLRAKFPLFRSFLVPSCVIAGILGFALMNIGALGMNTLENANTFTQLTNIFFTLSFISIGLTSADKAANKGAKSGKKGGLGKQIIRGAVGMGFVWCALYFVTPLIGYGSVALSNILAPKYAMDPVYGLLIPFAYTQGPGQSATFGALFESFGIENAAMVAITFSVVGFIVAFLVGIPCAKLGIKKGISKYSTEITKSVKKGVFPREEQTESMGFSTTHAGNIDTLTVHIALVGVTYLLTYLVTELINDATLRSMMFMTGMCMGYVIKAIMKLIKCDHIQDNNVQKRVTGFFTDFVVVCAFMAVQVSVIVKWLLPILIVCVVVGAVTYFVCLFFSKRFGDSNDFERFLGLWGTATGTVPTGIALVRIVDPEQKTTTAVELGAMNIAMMPSYAFIIVVSAYLQGTMGFAMMTIVLIAATALVLALNAIFKLWRKPTFSFSKGRLVFFDEQPVEETVAEGEQPAAAAAPALEDAVANTADDE